jgi:hypothetical protein
VREAVWEAMSDEEKDLAIRLAAERSGTDLAE